MSKQRLITSACILIATALLFVSRIWTTIPIDLAFGALAVFACIEVSRVAYSAGKFNNVYIASSYPAILYLLAMLYVNKKFNFNYFVFFFLITILAYFLFTFVLTMLTHKETIAEMGKVGYKGKKFQFAIDKAMFTLALLIYPATLFLCIILLNHFNELSMLADRLSYGNMSLFLLILTFAITMACDSMAMVTGIVFKGKKLCPTISPNKTISGAIGGLLGGVASAVIVYLLFTLSPDFVADFGAIGGSVWHILLVGLLGSIISQIGDILASVLKRHADVKDYGNVFPGHGGVMDRVDGLIFNAMFVLIFFALLTIF